MNDGDLNDRDKELRSPWHKSFQYMSRLQKKCLSEQKTEKYILIFHVSDHPPDCTLIGTSHFVRRPVTK